MPRLEPAFIDAGRGADIHKSGQVQCFGTTQAALDGFEALPEAMRQRARIEVRGTSTIYTADQVRRLGVARRQGW